MVEAARDGNHMVLYDSGYTFMLKKEGKAIRPALSPQTHICLSQDSFYTVFKEKPNELCYISAKDLFSREGRREFKAVSKFEDPILSLSSDGNFVYGCTKSLAFEALLKDGVPQIRKHETQGLKGLCISSYNYRFLMLVEEGAISYLYSPFNIKKSSYPLDKEIKEITAYDLLDENTSAIASKDGKIYLQSSTSFYKGKGISNILLASLRNPISRLRLISLKSPILIASSGKELCFWTDLNSPIYCARVFKGECKFDLFNLSPYSATLIVSYGAKHCYIFIGQKGETEIPAGYSQIFTKKKGDIGFYISVSHSLARGEAAKSVKQGDEIKEAKAGVSSSSLPKIPSAFLLPSLSPSPSMLSSPFLKSFDLVTSVKASKHHLSPFPSDAFKNLGEKKDPLLQKLALYK